MVCSSLPEARALFAEPILNVTDEDAIVHDRSASFFKISYKMVRRVLVVNSSRASIELIRDNILSMFSHVAVDLALSVEEALSRLELNSRGEIAGHEYDFVIVDEHCHSSVGGSEHKDDEDSEHLKVEMSGSQLLKRISDSETGQRKSLMIGVSNDLSEDCDSLRKGGADLLWANPPPKPTNCLRNQLLNTLLSKRGKSIFICGC